MGAVVSCIQSLFRTIGSVLMAIINGIGNILHAIISGVVTFIDILISFLTCGYCGGRHRSTTGTRRRGFGRRRHHATTSTI
ncbi:hypothetical protein F4810DRAFT_315057 [Camillea tinctor]|nr:hypothetical protein F4810DRAFT_315057 [Camillea tinctor]